MQSLPLLASRQFASIAPRSEVELGAGNNSGTHWQVHDPIELNAIALWHGERPPIVLLSFDLLYPGPAVVEAVRAALPGTVPVENILIAASHTHAAPITDSTKPSLGSPDPGYLLDLTATIRRVIRALFEPDSRTPVTLEVAQSRANHSVNRRRRFPLFYTDGRLKRNVVLPAPNPTGPTDEAVLVATLRTPSGAPFAAIWNYACHPVGYPTSKSVSAHFPGTVRQRIRSQTGADTAVLYLQGFSGDIRPNIPVHATALKNRLQRLLFGFGSGPFRAEDLQDWSDSLADVVLQCLAARQPPVEPKFFAAKHLLDGNAFAGPTNLEVAVQLLALGHKFTILAMSAEVVHEYAAYIRTKLPGGATMCVGCIDVPIGYIPTRRMLEEGGYEAGDYCESFSLESVNPNVEATTKQTFDAVIERLPLVR